MANAEIVSAFALQTVILNMIVFLIIKYFISSIFSMDHYDIYNNRIHFLWFK